MLTGRFQYCEPRERKRAKTTFLLGLENGKELRYYDDRLMGKAYLAREEEIGQMVPRWLEMGPDAMSAELSQERFLERLRSRRGQIKNVLTSEQCIAGLGNAYADEVLWEAKIHPCRKRTKISDEEMAELHRAVRTVMTWAIPIVIERMETEGLPSGHYREHLRVHRKGGQPCPRCGTRITEITAGQRITDFCRKCQP